MSNPFKDSLRIPADYFDSINQRIEGILSLNEKYYTNEYKELYKKHFLAEYLDLKSAFPNIDFDYSGRFKNKESMTEKVSRKIKENKSGNIYDNFANKIVVHSVDGCKDEKILKQACQEISDFLINYHSNFSNENLEELVDKRKNYISKPKSNGYQAIHIIRKHSKDESPSFLSETQIRTFRMEEQQQFGSSSHAVNYKKIKNMSMSRCPSFIEICRNKKTGIYKVHELTPEQSYERYLSYIKAIKIQNNPELLI